MNIMKVNSVKHMFDSGWELYPAGGITGEAFYACHNDEQLFIKRNSSPFLAVLSAEGIVPKLVWTRRLESGDTITAQQWITGRKLEPEDMASVSVAKLLNKIHQSKPLLSMLRRLGKSPVYPEMLIKELEIKINPTLKSYPFIAETIQYLKDHATDARQTNWSVCHGDVNHNNWLLTDDDQLYLIDWEGAIICDPAIDIGPMLYWYIPKEDWEKWLKAYNISLNEDLLFRMKWYVYYQTLSSINFYHEKNQPEDMNYWLNYLEMIHN